MKKLFTLFFAVTLFCFSSKAQDSVFFKEYSYGITTSNAGVNVCNTISKDLHYSKMNPLIPKMVSFDYAVKINKLIFGLGMDYGENHAAIRAPFYPLSMQLLNTRFNVKYNVFNKPKSSINLVSNFCLQAIRIRIDSTKDNSKIFETTSTRLEKDLLSLGLGLEYIHKSKITNSKGFIYGARATYNFYVHQSNWKKENYYNTSGYSNKDLGYGQLSLFVGYRFYYKVYRCK